MFMDRGSFIDFVLVLLLAAFSPPLMIFVHECGHALAVRARGLPLRTMRVGDEAGPAIVAGNFRMEFGPFLGKGELGGYVRYDGRAATPLDTL